MIDYQSIVRHYEDCLRQHGDNHRGVDWPNASDALKRYAVMLQVLPPRFDELSILDFGCGAGHLYEYLQQQMLGSVAYTGADLSTDFIDLCRRKYPQANWIQGDALKDNLQRWGRYDYLILNGVFTEKRQLPFAEMWSYTQQLLTRLWSITDRGLAVNFMSKHVDWERDDLFHLPFDVLAAFLVKQLSRHMVVRQDYGLYEYTVYVYKEPTWPK